MTREDVQATTMGHAEVNALLGFLRSRLDPEAVDRIAHEYARVTGPPGLPGLPSWAS